MLMSAPGALTIKVVALWELSKLIVPAALLVTSIAPFEALTMRLLAVTERLAAPPIEPFTDVKLRELEVRLPFMFEGLMLPSLDKFMVPPLVPVSIFCRLKVAPALLAVRVTVFPETGPEVATEDAEFARN